MKQRNNLTAMWRLGGALVLALGMTVGAQAAPVSLEQAKLALQGWLANGGTRLGAKLNLQQAEWMVVPAADGSVLYYVASLNPQGFIVVAADDQIEPIIVFSARGKFRLNANNPLFTILQGDLPARLATVSQALAAPADPGSRQVQAAMTAAEGNWRRLQSAGKVAGKRIPDTTVIYREPTIDDVRISPLIQSQWDQLYLKQIQVDLDGVDPLDTVDIYLYNYYTPKHLYCGCVATAMAQVMRFYTYPTEGIGIHEFPVTIDGLTAKRSTRGGDGAGGPYEWDLMDVVPAITMWDEGSDYYSETKRKAIGTLCYDAGVAVEMDYGTDGSGAFPDKVGPALRDIFKYGNSILYYKGSDIAATQRNVIINSNLDAGRPVLLSISNGGASGHEIVSDGYGYNEGTLYNHLNMGWGGFDDSWYALPALLRSGYKIVDGIEYNIRPAGLGEIVSGRVRNSDNQPVPGTTVTAVSTAGGSYNQTTTTNAEGIYAFDYVPSNTTLTLTATRTHCTFTPQSVSTTESVSPPEDLSSTGTCGNLWAVDFTGVLPYVALTVSDRNASENAGNPAVFVVSRTGGEIDQPLTVNFTTAGTAVYATDYALQDGYGAALTSPGSVEIPAGQTAAAVVVVPVDDSEVEGMETVSLTVEPGIYVITPAGTDTIKIQDNDGAVNHSPTAEGQTLSVAYNTPLAVTLLVDDADGDPLELIIVSPPTHGTLTGQMPTLTYTPFPGFSGTDAFYYNVYDGQAESDVVAIRIEVLSSTNHAPVISPNPSATVLGRSANVSVGATDADADALIYTWEKDSGPGYVSFAPNCTSDSKKSTASFSCPGVYVLKVTVRDNFTEVYKTVNVTVISAATPQTMDVESFVSRFYTFCLQRQPDQSGLNGWADSLIAGTQTGASVARGFVLSTEFVARNLTDSAYLDVLYSAFFDRVADDGGKQYWLARLAAGESRATVLGGFTGSVEFDVLCKRYGIVRDIP